jgi:hypothetical protein
MRFWRPSSTSTTARTADEPAPSSNASASSIRDGTVPFAPYQRAAANSAGGSAATNAATAANVVRS